MKVRREKNVITDIQGSLLGYNRTMMELKRQISVRICFLNQVIIVP